MTQKLLSPVCNTQLFDNQGKMLSNGTITVYTADTLTLAQIFSNEDGAPLANPITLNASGRIPVGQLFLDVGVSYDMQVKQGTTVLESYNGISGLLGTDSGVLGSILVDEFTGTGVQTSFTLEAAPFDADLVDVSINGLQLKKIDYNFIDNRIIFVQPPSLGDEIVVKQHRAIGVQLPSLYQRDRIYNSWTTTAGVLSYSLSNNPGKLENLIIVMDGLVLQKTIDYTWIVGSPLTLTLTVDPGTGKELSASYGDVLGILTPNTTDLVNYSTTGQVLTEFLDEFSSNDGAGKIGVDSGADYAEDTVGFLVVKNTSNGYNALRGFSKAEQSLIQAGTSVSDHAAILDSMLSTEKHLYLPRGTFRRSTKWSIADGTRVQGAGARMTSILLTADVVGLELTSSEFSHIEGFTLSKTGAHTSNGINIGTPAGVRADRGHLHDIIVTGMGAHGIVLYAGNLGTMGNIRSRSNTGDGLNFNRVASADNHAWTINGFIDASLNGGHGVRFEDGTGLTDAFASKTHHGGTIVAQSNTGWGVYIGSSRNALTIYSESNTAGNVLLNNFASGNKLVVVEGTVTGNVGGVPGNTDGNEIIQLNHNADTRAGFKSKVNVSGGTGKGIRISGDDGTAGFYEIEKQAIREVRFVGSGSGGAWNTYFSHSSGTGVQHAVNFGGQILPMADNAYVCGNTSLRWSSSSAVEFRPGAGAVKWSSGSGSPEGVYTAPVGSLWTRTDGGASTTLYVKESGTGNTGWVAK